MTERYDHIVANLLGNVMIAETLEHANQLAGRLKYRYRIVTLGGDVVNPGGSMTGGALQKKTNSLLGRQRIIDQLEQGNPQPRQRLRGIRHDGTI